MARTAPAASVATQPPATTTLESDAEQASSADSAPRAAVVAAAPQATARSAAAAAVGGMLAEPAAATNTRAFGSLGGGSGAIVAATGGGAVGAVAGSNWRCGRGQFEPCVGVRDTRDNLVTRSICQLDRRQEWNDCAPRRTRRHASAAQRREHRPGRGLGVVGDGVLDRGPQRNDPAHDRRRPALDAHPRADGGQSRGGDSDRRE